MRKPDHLIFIDCETTGLNPDVHQMLTFAYSLHPLPWPGLPEKAEIREFKIRYPEYIVDLGAMEVNGIDLIEHDAEARPADVVLCDIAAELCRCYAIPVGFSVDFDVRFLQAAMKQSKMPWLGGPNPISRHKLDITSVMITLSQQRGGNSWAPSLSQINRSGSAEYFGIDSPHAHTASGDVMTAMIVFDRLTSLIR